MAATPQRWQFREDRLENGLRVLTMEDHRTPLASVQVWYHVGSKDEDPERQGFAHMFEHMMFRGTDRIGPQDHFKYLQRYGARVNGYTSFDMTVYWETLPAAQLDRALWLEAERLGHLKINEDYFAAEREVVKEERRMRYLNKPYGKLYETLFASAYKVHPYRWTPIGNMPHLDAATAEELRAFFEKYYVPNNATVVVVGDVRHEHVVERVREYFGPIPRKPDPPRVKLAEPPFSAPVRVEMTDIAPSPMVVHAYHSPAGTDPDSIALDILSRILSSGQSSRLYRHMVQGKELAVNISGSDYTLEQNGLFVLSATLKPGVSVEAGEKALHEEVEALLAKGIEPAELAKARNQAIAEYVRTGETVQGRADQLGYAAVILGDADRVNTDLDRKRSITAQEILAVARRVFGGNNRIELVIRPSEQPTSAEATQDKSEKASEKIADLPSPKEMPSGRPPQPVDLPRPEVRKLDNGLQVAVFRDTSVPAVSISLNSLIGSKNDPPQQPGLAYVTVNTMRRGTRRHTGDELAELIDRHGMSYAESVDFNDTGLRLWTLSEHVELATQTLAEIAREPAFPEKEVSGFASRAAAREAINEKDPATLASRAFARALFGDHYLARPANGTSKSLATITRSAAAEFHQRYFSPKAATLIFAGDIQPERAFALAEKYFADWIGSLQADASPPPPAPSENRILLLDRPGAVQSEIRIGQVVPVSRRDADYAGVRLLSQIFGESFSGRLNRSLRIEKGLTYGASGYFDVKAEAAAFKMGTFTRTDKTAEAVRAALDEVRRLREGNITPAELEDARDTLIGQFQMALETPAQIAARWWDLIVWGLPQTWYATYLRDIANTRDPAVLNAIAKNRLDPAHLTTVVVGDAPKLEIPLRDIAPVQSAPADY